MWKFFLDLGIPIFVYMYRVYLGRSASGIPTIVNFMMALGKATYIVDVDSVKKFTDRNVLSISSYWSKVIPQKRKYEDIMSSHSINICLENIDQSFSSECADIEVEAISVLTSLES